MDEERMAEAELIWDLGAELAEGPAWSPREACLWFVDIKGRRIHRHEPATDGRRSWDAPDQVGFALPVDGGGLVCGMPHGLFRFDPGSGRFEQIGALEAERPQNRLNDGFVAPDGSLWFGSMDNTEATVSGALYRYADGRIARMDDGYRVTNGPAMSPDGRTLYHCDTVERRIYAFDHEHGQVSNRRLFAETVEGFADGPSVDAAGVVHVGLFNGWGVARFAPDGTPLETLRLPVMTCTKAAFGGEDLRTLYCTTAWLGNADKRAEQPTLGGLYAIRVETPGLPQAYARL